MQDFGVTKSRRLQFHRWIIIITLILSSCVESNMLLQFRGVDIPNRIGSVTDHAEILSAIEEEKLSSYIDSLVSIGFDDVSLLTVKTVPHKSIVSYTDRVFKKWGLGKKGRYDVLYILTGEEGRILVKASDQYFWGYNENYSQKLINEKVHTHLERGNYYNGVFIGLRQLLEMGYTEPPSPIGGYGSIANNIRYSEKASTQMISGTVILSATISEFGFVTDTVILKGIPETGLDEVAIEAVTNTYWNAAQLFGKPVERKISVPIVFR